ncbi:MAG: DUF4922 domain-containing protein [Melioribacteraceae bacterium]|nr:DUF4922 domain-containing protein [Melioribacteraceae bacterium]
MRNSRIVSDEELSNYLEVNSVTNKTKALFLHQINNWELAKQNYLDLNSIKKKVFEFNGFKIIVQFNQGRIVSSSAKVDIKSIEERPCFLCTNNLPAEQKGILCNNNYLILLNPFPIFEEHFTIPQLEHKPQEIYSNFIDMLNTSKELGERYTAFYNGPKCGASAPDHMHFQASLKNIMPVENELNYIYEHSIELLNDEKVRVAAVINYLRNFFIIETDDKTLANEEFQKLYNSIKEITSSDEEPLMNIIAAYSDRWRIYIFPRKAHRPKQFFAEGEDKILLSPAAVDFGGLLITPRKEDFEKITKENIIDIFKQTSVDETTIEKISAKYCK